MNKKQTISIVISAFNEEKRISACLESVQWADEIIVVDNESTDKTVEIAKKYKAKIYTKPNNLMLNVNKNFGISKTTSDWILCLDADEEVTQDLHEEIKTVLENTHVAGYYIPRRNIIFNKWIAHTGWYPDYQLRLFQRAKGKFAEKHVHEMLSIDGETEKLKNEMIHQNYSSVTQFLHKTFVIYAPNEAENLINNGYKLEWVDAMRFPAKEFISRFFAREGYKDGFHGLILSLLMAMYHLVVFAYIWEKKGFTEQSQADIVEGTEEEVKKISKDISYWFLHEKIKNEKNVFKKSLHKIKSKIL